VVSAWVRYHSAKRLPKEVTAGLNRLTGRQLAAVRASLPAPWCAPHWPYRREYWANMRRWHCRRHGPRSSRRGLAGPRGRPPRLLRRIAALMFFSAGISATHT
jgi:hypothetical protein